MKSRVKKTLIAVLALVLSLTLAVSGSAAGGFIDLISGDPLRAFFAILNMITTENKNKDYVERPLEQIVYTDAELKQKNAVAELINHDLNRVKSEKPAFSVTTNRGLPGTESKSVMGQISQYAGIADAIAKLLWGEEKNPLNTGTLLESIGITGFFSEIVTTKHLRGVDCKDAVSVKGADYVSALEGKDLYDISITKSRYDDSYTFKIYLQDAINPDENTAHGKVFDLFSDVQLYKTIKSLAPTLESEVIKIRYVNCYLSGRVDKYGNLAEYKTHYKCILKLDTASAGMDLSQYMSALDNKEIFESEVTYNNFNWEPRYFGDVNNDGKINSADARYVLRICAKLDEAQEDTLLYGDMNADGKITSIDARTLLRIAAGMQTVPPNAIDGTL